MTRLSDDAWRAKMEGKTFRQPEPLPLFDAPPTPPPPPARPITSEEVKAHAKAIGSAAAINPYGRDGPPTPIAPPTKGLDGMLAEHDRAHAAALGIPPSVVAAAPPPSTAAQETAARPPIVAIVCSRGRGGGCRRVELPNDEAADPWARARADKAPTPFEVGMDASAAAGNSWTPGEVATLRAAVRTVAARGLPFTSDDVWKLCPGVKFTKGMGSLLQGLAREGVMHSSGEHRVSTRGGPHDHAQSLTVWLPGLRQPKSGGAS